jgi:hypothetical protein
MKTSNTPIASHITLAHHYWATLLSPGDTVIDATCGNGHDTLALAKLVLKEGDGLLFGYDIQENAIAQTHLRLEKELPESIMKRVILLNASHETFTFPGESLPPIRLIVYNLGYLPGDNKDITTMTSTTLTSIQHAMEVLAVDGHISITCYPGHDEGSKEFLAMMEFVSKLPKESWACCHHQWVNKHDTAPSLLVLQKKK